MAPGSEVKKLQRFEKFDNRALIGFAQLFEVLGYAARFDGIGEADTALGTPTQMAIFETR